MVLPVRQQVLLALEGGGRLAQRRLGRLHAGLGRLHLGLLLVGIEPGQHLVGGDVVADIGQPLAILPPTRNETSLCTWAAITPVSVISGAKSVTRR